MEQMLFCKPACQHQHRYRQHLSSGFSRFLCLLINLTLYPLQHLCNGIFSQFLKDFHKIPAAESVVVLCKIQKFCRIFLVWTVFFIRCFHHHQTVISTPIVTILQKPELRSRDSYQIPGLYRFQL